MKERDFSLTSSCSTQARPGLGIRGTLPTLEGFLPAGLGLRLCLPDRDFEPGKDVVDNVADSMVTSRVILCVLSGSGPV